MQGTAPTAGRGAALERVVRAGDHQVVGVVDVRVVERCAPDGTSAVGERGGRRGQGGRGEDEEQGSRSIDRRMVEPLTAVGAGPVPIGHSLGCTTSAGTMRR